MDMPVQVPVDDPNADTEWNDILRAHNIIPPKPPSPTPLIEEALTEARALAHENRLESKDLDDLAALEDEEDEEFLASYRSRRLAELDALSKRGVHGSVYHIQKPEWTTAVTEASSDGKFVFVLLTAAGEGERGGERQDRQVVEAAGGGSAATGRSALESSIAAAAFADLAAAFADIKFCQIRAGMAIEGYRDGNCPTILVYRDGDVAKTVVRLSGLGKGAEKRGKEGVLQGLEGLMVEVGALEGVDARLRSRRRGREEREKEEAVNGEDSDEDNDWD